MERQGFSPPPGSLQQVYDRLFEAYGPQHWWPGDSRFEIIVGAVLTQNTAWTNVVKAINNLKAADKLSLAQLRQLPVEELADLIRPAGFFNIKAKRLRNLCDYLHAGGGVDAFESLPTKVFRAGLLGVNGVGPETADDILLYAYDRPVFAIDAYTRRIFSRLALASGKEDYEVLRGGFEQALGPNVEQFS
ncbi:MAG: endonuclease, partial [Chromatiales bacterium]|nr:endonuclease [Chromatiales bacterium]